MSSTERSADGGSSQFASDPNPPTYAAFSPATLGHYPTVNKQRSTILVHQKSPLLVATPPQITRALAYSHPFIHPLNKFVGLLSWTTGDPWESFLLVAAFWAVTLYGDVVVEWAGPVVAVIGLILGMYARRYSPLSSTGWTGEKGQKGHKRAVSEGSTRHHKSLDEIVDTLKLFTSRCNILLDPMLRLTDFLSTQRTATSATTRPALTTLFIRTLCVTPIWVALTLPPLQIINTKRVVLTLGTIVLSWHSRPARVSRTILWRSNTIRRICATVTGLDFGEPELPSAKKTDGPSLSARKQPKSANEIAASLAAKRRPESTGIRFTFTLYENQRRWLGIGWTASMLAYERAAWTDEHLNPAPPIDRFELPEVEGGHARWRWVEGSEWKIEGAEKSSGSNGSKNNSQENAGWIYYDNKWRDGRRGQDGWGRYTRRRKWYRDAELVEVTPSTEITPSPTPNPYGASRSETNISEADTVQPPDDGSGSGSAHGADSMSIKSDITDAASSKSGARKRRWFRRNRPPSEMSAAGGSSGSVDTAATAADKSEDTDEIHSPIRHEERDPWGLGDDARMELG